MENKVLEIRGRLLKYFITNSLLPDSLSNDPRALTPKMATFDYELCLLNNNFGISYLNNEALQFENDLNVFFIGIHKLALRMDKNNISLNDFSFSVKNVLLKVKNEWVLNISEYFCELMVSFIVYFIKFGNYIDLIVPTANFIIERHTIVGVTKQVLLMNLVLYATKTNKETMIKKILSLMDNSNEFFEILKNRVSFSSMQNTSIYSNDGNTYKVYFNNDNVSIAIQNILEYDQNIQKFFAPDIVEKVKYINFEGFFMEYFFFHVDELDHKF